MWSRPATLRRCAQLPTEYMREGGRAVKLLVTASKATALLGIGALFLEALFRVNLLKHFWLVAAQAALAAVVVVGVIAERFRYPGTPATESAGKEEVHSQSQPRSTRIQRAAVYFQMSHSTELVVALGLFALLIVLTALNVFRQTVNSDEPQHLHTIWGWTHGFVQYRDIFDNHMPLFQIALAPVFAALGERATIVYWMRLALLPMNFVAAWSTYQIGAALFSRRAGVWAMLAVGLFIGYYRDVTDFAPSNLWLPLWLLCIATLVSGTMNVHRALVAGLLLGLCFGVSMKSMVFLLSVAIGSSAAVLLCQKQINARWSALAAQTAAFLLGTVLVPAVIMAFFAWMGVWREFRYNVFDFNILADRFYESRIVYKSQPLLGFLILAMMLPPVLYIGRSIVHAPGTSRTAALRRTFILFVCASYFMVLQIFWAPISRVFRPIHPLAFVLVTGALLALPNQFSNRSTIRRICAIVPLPAFIAIAEVLVLLIVHPFFRWDRKSESGLLRQILVLTTPEDYVLDSKGETIFRKRTSPLIMERITNKAVQSAMLIDDTPKRCIETRTCVVSALAAGSFSEPTRQFIERNYLPVSNSLRVAGIKLKPTEASGRCDFAIVIPALYEIVSLDGNVSGILDSVPYDGPRFLAAGQHSFESKGSENTLFCVWSRAIDRGFMPFSHRAEAEK
jgi:hypothetical protein